MISVWNILVHLFFGLVGPCYSGNGGLLRSVRSEAKPESWDDLFEKILKNQYKSLATSNNSEDEQRMSSRDNLIRKLSISVDGTRSWFHDESSIRDQDRRRSTSGKRIRSSIKFKSCRQSAGACRRVQLRLQPNLRYFCREVQTFIFYIERVMQKWVRLIFAIEQYLVNSFEQKRRWFLTHDSSELITNKYNLFCCEVFYMNKVKSFYLERKDLCCWIQV